MENKKLKLMKDLMDQEKVEKRTVRNIAIFASIAIILTSPVVLSRDNRVEQTEQTMETEIIAAREMILEDGSIVHVVPSGYELTKDEEGNSIGVRTIVQNTATNEENTKSR